MAFLLTSLYFGATFCLFIYGVQCYVMMALFLRRYESGREENGRIEADARIHLNDNDWPAVLTQIPIFNERQVAERCLRAVAAIDYPRGKHRIQVLDDSTDETSAHVDEVVANLQRAGHAIEILRRTHRTGFKAGALTAGLACTDAPFVTMFDADFIPPADFLKRAMAHLVADSKLGLVQARWTHLNEDTSLLTLVQALGIDAHFAVEQCARAFNGLLMNFNGTAGIWRRQAIEDAGGWTADTLTEDIDLSYRAQLAGWRAHYLPDLEVPAELPETISAFRSQQMRWAKGSTQTTRKLLPAIMRSSLSPLAKVVAFFHLTHYFVHPLMLLLALVTLPMLKWVKLDLSPLGGTLFGLMILVSMFAPNALYALSQRALHRDWKRRLLRLPMLMPLGMGMVVSNSVAVFQGWFGAVGGEFVRTPKSGGKTAARIENRCWKVPAINLAFGAYTATGVFFSFPAGAWLVGPFLVLYTIGFFYLGLRGLAEWWAPATRVA
jgi:cellulose synthase/poly-beta-1,6-N-acetylglucosamine synthase-like glycosyltransferase